MAHNIIVLRGAVTFNGMLVDGGQIHDFDGTRQHKITALQPKTKILNLFLHGIPEGYKQLPETEFYADFTVPG